MSNHRRERNPPGPSVGSHAFHEQQQPRPRKVRNVTSAADRAELEQHYTFVPHNNNKQGGSSSSSSWKDRMVSTYHQHLFKEFVLADLSRSKESKVGLRWRTQAEVESGKGQTMCGNKHCPSYWSSTTGTEADAVDPRVLFDYHNRPVPSAEDEEQMRLDSIPHGAGLHSYEVPFSYVEHGEPKQELVKLRLCLRCAPLLFGSKPEPALEAFRARTEHPSPRANEGKDATANESISSDESSRQRRRHKKRRSKQKKRRKDLKRSRTTASTCHI